MKKEVDDYIARCLEFQKVKDDKKNPVGFLQPLPILEWKWEVVTIDFITKIPRTTKQHDSTVVVVDKLTKATHFTPVKLTHKETKIVDIYMGKISRLHGVPKEIVSDRDSKCTSKFWKGLFKGFGTNLNFSTTYHLDSYGKIQRVNKVIEDMLRIYVMDKPSKWEDYLNLWNTFNFFLLEIKFSHKKEKKNLEILLLNLKINPSLVEKALTIYTVD
jgi:hypothetical protein